MAHGHSCRQGKLWILRGLDCATSGSIFYMVLRYPCAATVKTKLTRLVKIVLKSTKPSTVYLAHRERIYPTER